MTLGPTSQSPLSRMARRGFRGYPVATVAWYGPDDRRATKVAVGIVRSESAEADPLQRWFSDDQDLRVDRSVRDEILRFIRSHGARSVVMADGIIGCPHEEGADYPLGRPCPRCVFWAIRDRWTGVVLQ